MVRWPLFTPPIAQWPDAGVYQLRIRLRRPALLKVGRLGSLSLDAGLYVYTGRAARALVARVRRHVVGGRSRHWHIDFLLAHPDARLERVELSSTDAGDECRVNQATGRTARRAILRFGSSDCRRSCPGHLWLVEAVADSRE